MKVLVQRVSRAAVRVDGRTVAGIGPGLLVFVGVEQGDGEREAAWFADKTADLRIFSDEAQLLNRSLAEVDGECLVVSQFTLVADTRRGRRPSFVRAAPPEEARPLYEHFLARLRERGLRVANGVFRAAMEVELVNDGPVTLWLEGPGGGS